MKLELRHSKIGDTAWDIVNNFEHRKDAIVYNMETFNNIFKALIRETVLVSLNISVKDANAIAKRECDRIKVRIGYYNGDRECYISYVLKFIDNYINSEAFRIMVLSFIKDVYYEQDIVVDYALDELVIDNKYSGEVVDINDNKTKSYISAMLCSMFIYLYNNKLTAYKNKSIRAVNINKVMKDMYIFKKKGYYWQTVGERTDGLGSKLIIPDVRNATPKATYDIEDKEYGELLGAEPESIENTLTLIKACVIKDISVNAYYDLIEDGIYNDNISVRIDYDIGILDIISGIIIGMTEGIVSNGDIPVFKSLTSVNYVDFVE